MGEEARRKRSDAIDQLRARLVSLEATDDRATEDDSDALLGAISEDLGEISTVGDLEPISESPRCDGDPPSSGPPESPARFPPPPVRISDPARTSAPSTFPPPPAGISASSTAPSIFPPPPEGRISVVREIPAASGANLGAISAAPPHLGTISEGGSARDYDLAAPDGDLSPRDGPISPRSPSIWTSPRRWTVNTPRRWRRSAKGSTAGTPKQPRGKSSGERRTGKKAAKGPAAELDEIITMPAVPYATPKPNPNPNPKPKCKPAPNPSPSPKREQVPYATFIAGASAREAP